MPKPTKGPRLGGGPAHERLLLANLAAALFTHKSIKTTETKAKRLRPVAERLITFAKRGDLHSRRRVLGVIGDKSVVHELFTQIAPLVENRPGGYTRITKLGFRKGDNAPMVQIELVLEPLAAASTRGAGRSRTAATAATGTATTTATAVTDEESADAVEETSPAGTTDDAAATDADVSAEGAADSDAADAIPAETVTSDEASVDEQAGGADAPADETPTK